MASYTIAVSLGHFSIASLLRRAVRFFVRFKKAIVVTMPAQNLLWLKLFIMSFIG